MILDLQLPDMEGIEVVRALRSHGLAMPFVLISAFLTTQSTVDAMKLGAVNVLEKPVSIDDVLPIVCSAVSERKEFRAVNVLSSRASGVTPTEISRHPTHVQRPRSTAQRWAMHALKACDSPNDLRTLEEWAASAGVSYTMLRENCRMVGVPPLAARDFVRMLRALVLARVQGCPPELLLDVADGRTLERLLQRAGLRSTSELGQFSLDHFFRRQQFLPSDNGAVHLLQKIMIEQRSES